MNTPAAMPGPQLRDIHLPPEPSWWPPAPGWWLLAALVLALLFVAARWLLRRARERRWRRRVRDEFERIAATPGAQADPVRLVADVSQLLRRAARVIEPQAAALRDEAWLRFLDQQLPPAHAGTEPFRTGAGRLLIDAPYRRAGDPAVHASDTNALLDLTRSWLVHALPRGRSHA